MVLERVNIKNFRVFLKKYFFLILLVIACVNVGENGLNCKVNDVFQSKCVKKLLCCCWKSVMTKNGLCLLCILTSFWVLRAPESWSNFFSVQFQTFFVDFRREISEKGKKWTNKLENGWKKVVQPAFRCAQHLKAGWNTQHLLLVG